MKSTVLYVLGIIVLAAGTLFALQGSDVVHWPAESFMLGKRDWVEYGIVVAIIGAMLVLTGWRIRRG
jgi:uncharacterized membrane protein YeaQ/YmgE (transglycosylase-associated protein family)